METQAVPTRTKYHRAAAFGGNGRWARSDPLPNHKSHQPTQPRRSSYPHSDHRWITLHYGTGGKCGRHSRVRVGVGAGGHVPEPEPTSYLLPEVHFCRAIRVGFWGAWKVMEACTREEQLSPGQHFSYIPPTSSLVTKLKYISVPTCVIMQGYGYHQVETPRGATTTQSSPP